MFYGSVQVTLRCAEMAYIIVAARNLRTTERTGDFARARRVSPRGRARMINYTERLSLLMEDIVQRVPTLSFIDMSKVLVFARLGRTTAEGAYATCHCVCLPPSEPGYYFWRDRRTRQADASLGVVRHEVAVRAASAAQPIDYMVSFTMPRFCDQLLSRSRKQVHYKGQPNWVAKLDTIVHELYHIDPRVPASAAWRRPTEPIRPIATATASSRTSWRW